MSIASQYGIKITNIVEGSIFLAICCILISAVEIHSGCFYSEFGSDEASHYVTGLMFHDYILSGMRTNPVQYLRFYHSHYPLVGVGHWGPVFYVLEAGWMMIFSSDRAAVLMLPAVLALITAILTYQFGRKHLCLSSVASAFSAFAFIVVPITQTATTEIMLDIPIALCGLTAMFFYTRFVQTERLKYSVLFGLCAGIAMLVKGNGMFLALVPPLVLVFSRKFYLLRLPAFWASAVIPGCMAGPWYLYTYGLVSQGFGYPWGLNYSAQALAGNSAFLFSAVGPAMLVLAAIGLVFGLGRGTVRTAGGIVLAASICSVWIFQCVVPAAIQDRYLMPLVPALILAAAMGGEFLYSTFLAWHVSRSTYQPYSPSETASPGIPGFVDHAAAHGWGGRRWVVYAIVFLTILPSALEVSPKPRLGWADLVPLLWAKRIQSNPVVLIVAPGASEAAAVAELAMNDPNRPSLLAVRGSRFLGGGGYNRTDYAAKFADSHQVEAEINDLRVPFILYQADPGGWEHVSQVDAALRETQDSWRVLGVAGHASDPVTLYERPQAVMLQADLERWLELTGPRSLK